MAYFVAFLLVISVADFVGENGANEEIGNLARKQSNYFISSQFGCEPKPIISFNRALYTKISKDNRLYPSPSTF